MGFFEVIAFTFPILSLAVAALALRIDAKAFIGVRKNINYILAMNVSTSVMWIMYFFALGHVEPSLVNMLFLASMLLAAVIAVRSRRSPVREAAISLIERRFYHALAAMIVAIILVVMLGYSGSDETTAFSALGLLATIASGIGGAWSGLFERKLNENGLSIGAVLVCRFPFVTVIALSVVLMSPGEAFSGLAAETIWLLVAVFLLVSVPVFIAQAAVATTSPITLRSIIALAPLMIVALQWLEGRIAFSPAVLGLTVAYAALVIGVNLVRGWKSDFA